MQQGVSVVKASAGSGKTYRLTQDYIDLLLSGDAQR
ncbi:MAG: UvrD-helicase domain-containing protein, partial [Bacteroidales bacterium]|nr:UvrD-helicase domain-containing protein [Bacteroidales bacterium]